MFARQGSLDFVPSRRPPKGKLGCITCRRRRVKCDETKPVCKRCLALSIQCVGSLYSGYGRSANSLASSSQNTRVTTSGELTDALCITSLAKFTLDRGADSLRLIQVLPNEWHYLESRRFFQHAMQPHMSQTHLIPNNATICHSGSDQLARITMDGVIADMLALRIAILSSQSHSGAKPCRNQGNHYLWHRLYDHMNSAMGSINRALAAEVPILNGQLLGNINRLRQVEISLKSPAWRQHSEGYLGVLRMCFKENLETVSAQFGPQTQDIFLEVIIANTVSPPDRQVAALSQFSKAEILSIIADNCHPGLPCPTALLLAIMIITELRQKMYFGTPILSGASLDEQVVDIFGRIESFSPEEWTESYPIPDIPETRILASIFKQTVGLYGLLTLPTKQLPVVMPVDLLTDKKRDELFTLIETIWTTPASRVSLNWPLAVVGQALRTGSVVQQNRVCQLLDDAAADPLANHPLMIKEKLQKFWESGKQTWDECWDDGFVVIY